MTGQSCLVLNLGLAKVTFIRNILIIDSMHLQTLTIWVGIITFVTVEPELFTFSFLSYNFLRITVSIVKFSWHTTQPSSRQECFFQPTSPREDICCLFLTIQQSRQKSFCYFLLISMACSNGASKLLLFVLGLWMVGVLSHSPQSRDIAIFFTMDPLQLNIDIPLPIITHL